MGKLDGDMFSGIRHRARKKIKAINRMTDDEFAKLLISFDAFIEYAAETKKFADVGFYEKAKATLKAERAKVAELQELVRPKIIRHLITECNHSAGMKICNNCQQRNIILQLDQSKCEAQAQLTALRERLEGLVWKWKEGDFDLPDYTRGKMDGRHECAKQLLAVLGD